MIEKLFLGCRLGFGFNLLARTEIKGGLITSYNPAFILDYCGRLTEKVRLVERYWEDDFTVMMEH